MAAGEIIPLRTPAVAQSERAPESRTDDELMLMTRGGSQTAFEVLVRRHQRRVLRVAYSYLGDSVAAKDAAQNTFLDVYLYAPRYDPRGKFKAFLYRVLLNNCRMAHRRTRRERLAMAELVAESQTVDDPRSEDRILQREQQRELHRAIGRLSKRLRRVVILRYAGGLSHPEIAQALGVPVGTVKSRLFAAMRRLRRLMPGGRGR
jgi:RNA polymerase sigma-70 factor (ECF subfamily)